MSGREPLSAPSFLCGIFQVRSFDQLGRALHEAGIEQKNPVILFTNEVVGGVMRTAPTGVSQPRIAGDASGGEGQG